MKNKMKQNKNSSVVLRVASVTLAAVFLFCSLSIPSFAVATNGLTFSGQPLPVVSSSSGLSTTGFYAGYTTRSSTESWKYYFGSYNSPSDVYCFAVTSGTYISFVLASRSQGEYVYDAHGSGSDYINTASSNMFSSVSPALYYHSHTVQWAVPSATTFFVPTYDSVEDGLNAVNAYIDSGGGSSVLASDFSYSVPAGYALFVDIHGLSGVTGTLSTNTPNRAYASPHTSNQTIAYTNSIASAGSSPIGNGINWEGVGSRDLFGRYKSWTRSLIIQPGSNYVAIYNPVHVDSYVDVEHEDYNSAINVYISQAYTGSSKLIPLNTELTSTGQVGTVSTDQEKPMQQDPDTGGWYPTNEDGTPYNPNPYGDYLPETSNSIHQWLQNIAQSISGFFQGAIGAVTTLVGAGSAFINQLISLYSWLPGPVYAVLSSALIIVITIGVIKVFV